MRFYAVEVVRLWMMRGSGNLKCVKIALLFPKQVSFELLGFKFVGLISYSCMSMVVLS